MEEFMLINRGILSTYKDDTVKYMLNMFLKYWTPNHEKQLEAVKSLY